MEMGFRSAWGSVRSGRARKPHRSLKTPALALKKYIYIWGELNKEMVFGALRDRSIDVSLGGC